MIISLDATSTGVMTSSTATSYSFSHTVGLLLGNRILIVCAGIKASGGAIATGMTCTYNGVSMTKAVEYQQGGTNNIYCAIFYLINPSTGANTVALSWSGTAAGAFHATSLYNVSPSNPIRATNTLEVLTGARSLNVSSISGDWVFDVMTLAATTTMTVGANQTQLLNLGAVGNICRTCGSYEVAGGSSTTMSWTPDASGTFTVMCGASVIPASEVGQAAISPSMIF